MNISIFDPLDSAIAINLNIKTVYKSAHTELLERHR